MATPAQIAANQANAAHSTGPRTDEGKSRTRGNATRHGLCSTTAVMSDEDQGVFDRLHNDLLAEYQPATPTEEMLVFKMAVNFFSFAHAENLLAVRLAVNEREDDSKQVALMMRYQSSADRQFNRNLNDLRKIQKERRRPDVQPDAISFPTSDVQREDTGQEPRAMERDRSIGSVSQPAQPEAAAPGQIGFVQQNVAARPDAPAHFSSEKPVCVADAPSATLKTAPVSPQKAA